MTDQNSQKPAPPVAPPAPAVSTQVAPAAPQPVPQPSSQPNTVPLASYVPPQAPAGQENSTLPHAEAPTQVIQVGKYKVEVIRDKCIGAASCVAIAPNTFALDEHEIAVIIAQNGDDDETELLAAQSCPTAAIIVTDTSTGEQVWPRE